MCCFSIYLCLFWFISALFLFSFWCKSFASLVKFITKYFIFLNVIVNEISFISISECSVLVYEDVTYFCMLVLYCATLLNSFIGSNSCACVCVCVCVYVTSFFPKDDIISFMNSDRFTYSFLIWMTHFFFLPNLSG